jgi:hypothetical protein
MIIRNLMDGSQNVLGLSVGLDAVLTRRIPVNVTQAVSVSPWLLEHSLLSRELSLLGSTRDRATIHRLYKKPLVRNQLRV